MKTNRKAAVLALGLALLSPLAGAALVDTEWWKVDFTSPTPEGTNEQGAVVGDVELFDGDSVSVLTNTVVSTVGDVTYKPAYASGFWSMADGDESVITNSVVTNALEGTSEESLHIKLDTQGNDLVWAPSNGVPDVINLVDADLLLVGSDSAPDHEDFDPTNATKRVQTAIFLKNATDEESGETTNSVLCVYSRNTNTGKNEWMELTGDVKIEDNSWHHVQVSIDYTDVQGIPIVVVKVDGKTMSPASGSTIKVANPTESKTAAKVQEVCFRGTGALDNFVGKTQINEVQDLWYEAVVYKDDVPQPFAAGTEEGNRSRRALASSGPDGHTFQNFDLSNKSSANENDPLYTLSRIELTNFVEQTSLILNYTWDESSQQIIEATPTNLVNIPINSRTKKQTGKFHLSIFTENAEEPTNVAARIYFKTLGAFYANAVTEIGDNVATNGTLLKPVAAGGTYPTNLVWTFPATDGANILTGVTVSNGATATYDAANGVATVTVTLTEALAADTTFAAATYAEGSYEGKTPSWIDNGNGSYVLGNYVAKIDGDPKPVYYPTLQAAIAVVQEDAATTSTVTLLASVDEDVTIPLGKNVELDLNGCAITNVASDTISVYGTLVLTDSSENTNGIVASAIANKAAIVNYPGGNVVIEAGTIAVPDNATYYNIKNMGAMTIEEGAVIVSRVSTASTLIANGWYGNATTDRGTTGQADTAILTINGGMFDGGKNVVKNDDYGILVIEGGSFSNLSDVDAVILNWNDTTINGGEFTGVTKILCNGSYGANSADKGVMTINGGTFRANGEQGNLFGYGTQGGKMSDALLEITGGTFYGHVAGLGDNDGTFGVAAISGGSFSEVVPQIYCAQDFVPVTTADPVTGLYTVKPGSIQVTDGTDVFTYGAFADAIPVHGWGATYTLLTNVEETVAITNADDSFTVLFADADFTNDLAVVSGVAATPSTEYAVVCTNIAGGAVWLLEPTVRTYDVMFMNGGAQFATTNVAYGTTEYAPTGTPTKAATAQFSYAFAGWSDTADGEALASLPAITNDATFYAAFAATTNEYTITWTMDDDSVIDTTTVPYGTVPTHADPSKTDTEQFAYTFTGWDPEVVAVEGEATYKATFSVVVRSYDIRFFDGDELDGEDPYAKTNVPYGTPAALYAPADPTKDATSLTNFTFAGWTNKVYGGAALFAADLPTVSNETSWVAVWTETPIWKVDFYAGEDGGTVCYTTNVLNGTELEQPAAADLDPAPSKAATASHTFAFAGWTDAIGGEQVRWAQTITGDTAFYPVFESNAIAFAITYVLDGGTNSAANPTNYTVETETFSLAPAGKEGFDFLGWIDESGATNMAPAIAKGSTGDRTFTAAFQAKAPEHVGAAAAENGFMILSPEDPSQPEAPVFTLAPTMNGLNGTTRISASFVKPEGVTSATVKLVYKKSLAADAQKFYADATITNIDLANGTADVAYTLPQDEDTIFLVGFTDGEPAGNGD